ncbi:MFS transporter [Chitinophagaceae bacterium MMS25-I14]
MKTIKEQHRGIATFLSLALIPLSGFATDIYVPSLPSMAASLHASNGQVQLSLLVFLVSAGLSQLFVGSLLDSFGRYKISNAALLVFSLSSFMIAWFPNVYVLFAMRVIQGITNAMIVVAKRAYFMDTFTGDKLKNYTSLFSIIWATAPIIAPFLGGYLQEAFGWQSNFYFLGGITLLILALTLIYGGESIKSYQKFDLKSIAGVYASMIKTKDFSIGLMIIGLSYGMLIVFGMTSPFIIEHIYHLSPVYTGYAALLSGVALMSGGIISKSMLSKPLGQKVPAAMGLQLFVAVLMIVFSSMFSASIYSMMLFVILIHMGAGFIFNNMFAYSLGRFTGNAGIASGLTGGGMYVVTSFFSYSTVGLLHVNSAIWLGLTYLILILFSAVAFGLFRLVKLREEKAKLRAIQVEGYYTI